MLIRYRPKDGPVDSDGLVKVHLLKMVSIQTLSNRDLIALQHATTALGEPLNLGVLMVWEAELAKIKGATKAETLQLKQVDPRGQMLFTVQLWAAMKFAGLRATFDDALDVTLDQIVGYVTEADDPDEMLDVVDPTRRLAPKTGSRAGSAKATAKRASGRKSAPRKR